MDSNLTIPCFGSDPQQPPLLPTDPNLQLSPSLVGSASGSGSSSSETELESEPKRQKVDEAPAGDNSSDEEEEWTQVFPERSRVYFPPDEQGQAKLKRFHQQVFDSEGFDFDEYPPVDVIAYGVLRVDMNSAWWNERVHLCMNHVVAEQNGRDDGVLNLEGAVPVKANRQTVDGCVYFITFKARNLLCADPKDAVKVYEAQVFRRFNGVMRTDLFREQGRKEAPFVDFPARLKIIRFADCDCGASGPCDC